MNIGYSIVGVILLGLAVYIGKLLFKEYKEGIQPSPDDKLYDLRWKIEYSTVDNHSELYFIQRFKELKQDETVDKDKLEKLEIMFKQKFQDLHTTT